MPSKKRQIGIRLTPENEERLKRVVAMMRKATNIEVTITDVFNVALIELENRYLAEQPSKEKRRRGDE